MTKYIFTGGPGVGKTTLLERLAEKGYEVVPEAARPVIKEQQEKQHPILPWTNFQKFEEIVLERQLEYEQAMPGADFLDRSLIDHLAYALTGGAKLRSDIYDLIKKANYTRVFFLEQLPDYCQDDQRKEDPVKAKIIHDKLYELYDHLGCDIVTVPPVSVDERLDLILNEIK